MASSSIPSFSPTSPTSPSSSYSSSCSNHQYQRIRSPPSTRHRRLRQFLFAISVLLLSPPPTHNNKISSTSSTLFAHAFTCTSSTTPGIMVSTGQYMTLGWSLTTLDSYLYDSLTALVYCMDYSGPDDNVWREVSTLFSNTAIWPTSSFSFKMPNCGPLVGATAVRMVAQGWGGAFYEEDACIFEVKALTMTPQPVATSTSTTPNSFKMPQPTTTVNPLIQPTTTAPPPVTYNPFPLIVPSPRSTEGVTTPEVTTLPNTATMGPSTKVDPGAQTTASSSGGSGGGGTGTTFSPAVVTHPPLPPLPTFPNGGGVSPPGGPAVEKNDNSLALKATLLSVGVFAGLAAVVVPLLVMRRRRMRRNRQSASRSEDLLSGGAAPGSAGAGGVMKETKRRRLGKNSKEGYFYQMEEEEDDENFDHMQQSSGDLEKRYAAAPAATAPAAAVAVASSEDGTETRDKSVKAVGAGVGQLDAVTVPQMALLGDTTAASYHKRRSSLPYMVTSHYTMSSIDDGSSINDDSSVVRRYWAASMAARAERRLEGHSPTRGLDSEDDVYGYDEGSIFGNQSRDSDSRMADILSLRTTGSMSGTAGGTMDTTRHHLYEQYHQQLPYRRDTLNTSFGDGISTRTMTPSLSSGQDSCPFSEEEFLERMHLEQLQAQLQHEYYSQQQREQRYTDSMISRRTSSVPSLTSTNDPFKTFDSNEIVLDQDQDQDHDPFADDPFSDSRRCTPSPSPSPSLRVPTMSDRSNSDLAGSFPGVPTSP